MSFLLVHCAPSQLLKAVLCTINIVKSKTTNMRSLKITLTLTALVTVFLLTVSGQNPEKQIGNTDTYQLDKTNHDNGFAGIDKKKKARPNA